MNVVFLGTPPFIQTIKDTLAKHFTLVDSLSDADLVVVAAYGKILTKSELNSPKYGCINIHPSLLPKYRGPSPIQATILNGDVVSGITVIKMDEEIDHGPIIYQDQFALSGNDNTGTLSKKVFLRAAQILPKVVEDFVQDKLILKPQDHSKAIYCPLYTRNSGYFDINSPPEPEKLDRMIRAYYPWPGVWTRWKNKIVKFLPGKLLQMEGGKPTPLKVFLNNYPNFPIKFGYLTSK